MMKRNKTLLTLLFSFILIFAFSTFIFARNSLCDFPELVCIQSTSNISQNFMVDEIHKSYINDFAIYEEDEHNDVIIFYISDFSILKTHIYSYIHEYSYEAPNGNTFTFCDYINFKPDFGFYTYLEQSTVYSNFDEFSSMLNGYANLISFLNTENNNNPEDYYGLLLNYNQLLTTYENLSNSYSSLQIEYDTLFEELNCYKDLYNELSTEYDNLSLSFRNLGNSMAQLENAYSELLKNYDALENSKESEIQALNDRINELNLALSNKEKELSNKNKEYNSMIKYWEEEYDILLKNSAYSYNDGFNAGLIEADVFSDGLITIFSSPMYIFGEIFDFEIFGINFLDIIKFMLTIAIVGFVLRKIRS